MEIKLYRKQAEKGDVLCVERTPHKHFSVYIGDFRVIHYTKSASVCIQESPLEKFLKGDKYYVVEYFSTAKMLETQEINSVFDIFRELSRFGDYIDVAFKESFQNFKIYTADETVNRAKSKLGEEEYNFFFNNCEHFATWCKTGLAESYQIKKVISTVIVPGQFLRNIIDR